MGILNYEPPDGARPPAAGEAAAGHGGAGQPRDCPHVGVPQLPQVLLPGVIAHTDAGDEAPDDGKRGAQANVVVEILNRLPHSEVLSPFVQDLLKVSLQVLTQDNEDNALIAVRIIFDLLRSFRPTREAEVQSFVDFVCTIYNNFPSTVSHFFSPSAVGGVAGSSSMIPVGGGVGIGGLSIPGGGDDGNVGLDGPGGSIMPYIGSGQLNPSTRSFKIVTESPLVVMFLFQLYGKLVQTNLPFLLPLMVAAISVPGPKKVPPHLKNQFVELKSAQVKTLSFLTYLLKSCPVKPHEENVCKSIVDLLVTCPDSVSIRKELLFA